MQAFYIPHPNINFRRQRTKKTQRFTFHILHFGFVKLSPATKSLTKSHFKQFLFFSCADLIFPKLKLIF